MKERKKFSVLAGTIILFLVVILLGYTGRAEAAGKVQLKNTTISVYKTVYTYNGRVQKPAVSVRYRGKKLSVNKDYTLVYSKGRKNPGVYTVAVKGKGSYSGTVKKTFRINPVGTKLASMQSPSGGTTLKLTWKRPSRAVSGYQIRYSTRSDFKGAKLQTISGATRLTTTLRSLKPATRYYLQIRSFYRYVKGKYVYSAWSARTAKATAKKAGSPSNGNTNNGNTNNNGNADPLGFLNETYASLRKKTGETFEIYVTNEIQSVNFSKSDVVMQVNKGSKYFFYFTAINPGKTSITFTDIYGQKISSSVTVTEETYQDGKTTEMDSAKYNANLPVPKIQSVNYSEYYMGVICPGTFSASDPYSGYEGWLSETRDFDQYLEYDSTDSDWNGQGYGKLSFFSNYDRSGTTYYLKVRSFKLNGTTKIYGPWSSIKTVSVGNYRVASSAKAKYSYKFYFLDTAGIGLYGGVSKAVYIQTDNPDPNSIQLLSNGKTVLIKLSNLGGGQYYDDIEYLNADDYDNSLHKVKGGYVGEVEFKKAGNYDVEVREIHKEGYVTAKTLHWTVKDYNTDLYAWMDQIIAANTNSSMTSFEKMDAVCEYLTSKDRFSYHTMSNGKTVTLASIPNGPCFLSHRWNSYVSPSMLCVFAERIGGFDKIHNCYGDYTVESSEWSYTHYYAKLTIGSEDRLYAVCPSSFTGEIGEVKKIDFSNTKVLRPAK